MLVFRRSGAGRGSHALRRVGLRSSTSSPARPPDLLELYRQEVNRGALQWDEQQVRTVVALRHVHRRLSTYTPAPRLLQTLPPSPIIPSPPRTSIWPFRPKQRSAAELDGLELVRIQTIEEELAALPAPRGLILTGPPGTGKTRLVQLLFDALQTERKIKRHYHSFLLQIYHLLHLEGQRTVQGVYGTVAAPGKDRDYSGWRREDELAFKVAKRLMSEEGWLIFFDELQLTDIATASLVQGVLLHYWRLGGVLLSTSNRLPSDLYGNGVQRKRVESFISCLKGRCEMLELDGGRDWRHREGREGLEEGGSWTVDDERGVGRARWEAGWAAAVDGRPVSPQSIFIYNRPLTILRQTGAANDLPSSRAAHLTFTELCENALGSADFLSIASTYGTIFLSDVPALTITKKNEARRLINLIDSLYEHRVHLHVLSSVPLDALFFSDATTAGESAELAESLEEEALSEMLKEVDEPTRPNVSVYEAREEQQLEPAATPRSTMARDFRNLSIYSGEDERFAFKRALSRLQELTNPSLARAPHTPLPASLRTWERSPSSASTTSSTAAPDRPALEHAHDFGAEAAFLSHPAAAAAAVGAAAAGGDVIRAGGPRENPTKLRSEGHFWGLVQRKTT